MTFRRVTPVSGPRSYRMSVVGRSIFVIWLLSCAVLVITVLARPTDATDAYFSAYFGVLGVWIGTAAATALLAVFVQVQMRRERRMGFTWSRDNFQNLDEIDPVSYVVIRAAGEPFLTPQQRRSLVAQARSWAAEVADN